MRECCLALYWPLCCIVLHDACVRFTTAFTAVAAQNATLTTNIEELQQQLAAATASAEAQAAEAAEAKTALEQHVTELKATEVRHAPGEVQCLQERVCSSAYWPAELPCILQDMQLACRKCRMRLHCCAVLWCMPVFMNSSSYVESAECLVRSLALLCRPR
jgi:hypothetical protein